MSDWLLKAGIVIILAVLVAIICTAIICQFVDTTEAKFQPGQMVEFKTGGIGQVIRRVRENEGMPWNLTPVFRYEVRRENGWAVWYQEWELGPE